jgi:dTDP-4-dehydrorhamnose 3,5-epimerase
LEAVKTSLCKSGFKFSSTPIPGVIVIEPPIFEDQRGYFTEAYRKDEFFNAGITTEFVQENRSFSQRGVLRGLHMQVKHPQAKLVTVLEGEIFDVCVDLRRDSKSYGKWHGLTLSGRNKRQFYIPRGLLHGFVVVSETALVSYKCDDYYAPGDEAGMIWNDPTVRIQWPEGIEPILSEKDKRLPPFGDLS